MSVGRWKICSRMWVGDIPKRYPRLWKGCGVQNRWKFDSGL